MAVRRVENVRHDNPQEVYVSLHKFRLDQNPLRNRLSVDIRIDHLERWSIPDLSSTTTSVSRGSISQRSHTFYTTDLLRVDDGGNLSSLVFLLQTQALSTMLFH